MRILQCYRASHTGGQVQTDEFMGKRSNNGYLLIWTRLEPSLIYCQSLIVDPILHDLAIATKPLAENI